MWKDTDLCEKKPRSSLVSSNERRVVWSRRHVTRNSESQFHVRLTPLQGFTKHTKLRKQHKHGRAVVIRPWENITIKVAQEPTWLGGNEGNLSTTPQCGTGGRSCHGSKVHPGRCCQSSLTRKPWGRAQRLHLQTLAPQRVVETPLDKVRPRQPLVYTSCPKFVACQWTKLFHSLPSCSMLSILYLMSQRHRGTTVSKGQMISSFMAGSFVKSRPNRKQLFLTSKPWLIKFGIFPRTGIKEFQ